MPPTDAVTVLTTVASAEEAAGHPLQLLTGHDLIRHGVPQGKHYKLLLDRVRDAQLEKTIRSKKDALALVDIRVLDHVIVGDDQTVSFAQRGLL